MIGGSGSLAYVRETVIRAEPTTVFAFCADLRNELRWNPEAVAIEQVGDGPIGVGTRFRAKWKRAPAATIEVTRFDAPGAWETRSETMGMEARTSGWVEPAQGGSLYRIRVELRPRGISRLFAPLALWMMRRQETRNMALITAAVESTQP